MKKQELRIAGVPAVLYGERSRRVYLYVHGINGCKEEAQSFATRACKAGWQVLSVDLPEHGSRRTEPQKLLPWVVVPELQRVYARMKQVWARVALYGVSIGAWFALYATRNDPPCRVLLVSPVVDMEALILRRMQEAGATEAQLQAAGEIPVPGGQDLSWRYLCWVRENPLCWKTPVQLLYGSADGITTPGELERFRQQSGARLTIFEGGEHWFHTDLQLAVLHSWEDAQL